MTCRVVAQVHLDEASGAAAAERLAGALTSVAEVLPSVEAAHAGVHAPLSVGGGDLTWDLLFDAAAAADRFFALVERHSAQEVFEQLQLGRTSDADVAASLVAIELARPESISVGLGSPGLVGVKRTLWLRVLPEADAEQRDLFERETPLLAQAVPAIRNWRWSRIRPVASRGLPTPGWTHLWEQEFEDYAGLEVDYMSSPCHWGYIDRYFDPEMPDRIVDVALAHLACPETAPVLSWERDA